MILDVSLTGSTTPTIKAITTTDDNNDDRKSKKSISSVHDAPIDDMPKAKEDLTYKLDRNSDKVQNGPSKNEYSLQAWHVTFNARF